MSEKSIYTYNNGRAWITEKDKELLKLIWLHKSVTVSQVRFFLLKAYGMKKSAVYKKLQKWNELKITKTQVYSGRKKVQLRCVQMNKNGIDILVNEGVIHNSTYPLVELPNPKTADHFFLTREIVIRTYLEFYKKGGRFTSIPPLETPYYDTKVKKAYKEQGKNLLKIPTLVEPDWILYSDSSILNIESDTGHERANTIIDKVKRYVEYNAQNLEHKDHHILIAPIDSADDDILCYVEDRPKERKKRVSQIKEYVIRASAHIIPNLNFHVVTSSRAGKVAYNILTGKTKEHSYVLNESIGALETNKHLNVSMVKRLPEEFYTGNVLNSYFADGHFDMKREGEKVKTFLIKVMDEGCVKSLDQLAYLNWLLEKDRYKSHVDGILAIYQTEEERLHDNLGDLWELNHVYFSSLERLQRNSIDGSTFYQQTSKFKRKKVLLYEG